MEMTTPLDSDALVAMIDRYGRLQAQHGDAARLAHEDSENMALGKAAVDLETTSMEIRYEWGAALLELCQADAEVTEDQMRALYEVIDGWAFGLWHAAWHAALGGAVDGGDLEEWKRLEVEPQRSVWEPAVRAVADRARR